MAHYSNTRKFAIKRLSQTFNLLRKSKEYMAEIGALTDKQHPGEYEEIENIYISLTLTQDAVATLARDVFGASERAIRQWYTE